MLDSPDNTSYNSRRYLIEEDGSSDASSKTNYENQQSIESMYDDIIKKSGGFSSYQKIATLLILSTFALYYS